MHGGILGGKRVREDDGGGGGSRGGGGSSRPRVDEGASHYNNMRNMIVRVVDKGYDVQLQHLSGLHSTLKHVRRDQIIGIIMECAKSLPVKVGIYGTLVGLLNIDSPEFGGEVVRMLTNAAPGSLRGEDMALLRLLVRFAAELCNASVLEAASLHHLFKSMLAIAQSAESEGGPERQRGDCMCHAVLAALPFAAAGLKVADRAILDDTIKQSRSYEDSRLRLPIRRLAMSLRPGVEAVDSLEIVWSSVRDCAEQADPDDWVTALAVLRPYQIPQFREEPGNAERHAFEEGFLGVSPVRPGHGVLE